MAVGAADDQGLVVILEGLIVFAQAVSDVSEAVQGVGLAERPLAVGVLAQQREGAWQLARALA